jgi:transcriptional regulator with XRE-family HTH domain
VATSPGPRRRALGEFLRARRAELDPRDRGLPPVPRVRAPGLRRADVARLANISESWYTRLEQGRAAEPSAAVLDALAAALELDPFERRYMHLLAVGRAPHRDQPFTAESTALAARLVTHLDPHPAYVADVFGTVYACNDACRSWLADFTAPGAQRNVFDWVIHDPAARQRFPDWAGEVRDVLARFRGATALGLDDARAEAFVRRIRAHSPEAWALWGRHEVSDISSRIRVLRHPELGIRRFRIHVLTVGGADGVGVVLHTPE